MATAKRTTKKTAKRKPAKKTTKRKTTKRKPTKRKPVAKVAAPVEPVTAEPVTAEPVTTEPEPGELDFAKLERLWEENPPKPIQDPHFTEMERAFYGDEDDPNSPNMSVAELSTCWEKGPNVDATFGPASADYDSRLPEICTAITSDGELPVPLSGTDPFGIQALHLAWRSGTREGMKLIRHHELGQAFPNGCILSAHVERWMKAHGWTQPPIASVDLPQRVLMYREEGERKDVVFLPKFDGPTNDDDDDTAIEMNKEYPKWMDALIHELALIHGRGVVDLCYAIADVERMEPEERKPDQVLSLIVGKVKTKADPVEPATDKDALSMKPVVVRSIRSA